MADSFEPIETQEQFDQMVSRRIAREATKYTDQIKDLTGQVERLTADANAAAQAQTQAKAELTELRSKVAKYETDSVKMGIADEYGLPSGFYSRLQGENADEWRADAQDLQKLFAAGRRRSVPLRSTEQTEDGDDRRAALRKMAQAVKGEN